MSQAVYVVSDLHIGADPELDDFSSDEEFDGFIAKIERDRQGSNVELVLLGDVFDLWQIVPEHDKRAEKSDEIELILSEAGEAEKLHRAAERHPNVFGALRRFLQGDPQLRRLIIVPGNHDHSLVEPSVQQTLRELLGVTHSLSETALHFSPSYDNPTLGIYAEHGNQYDQENNSYKDFEQFGPMKECAGYFFVRLFWNRLEHLDAQLDNIYPDRSWEVFLWILRTGHWFLLGPALRYFHQYRSDMRVPKLINVPGVPFFAVATGEKVLPGMPERLLDPSARSSPYFSADPGVENEYLRLYRDNPKARAEILHLLREKFDQVPELPPPSETVTFSYVQPFALEKDPYLAFVERMFTNSPDPQKPSLRSALLEPETYHYIVLGHTHEDKTERVNTVGNATYFNTGSWISRIDSSGNPVFRRTYLAIEQDAAGNVSERLDQFGN